MSNWLKTAVESEESAAKEARIRAVVDAYRKELDDRHHVSAPRYYGKHPDQPQADYDDRMSKIYNIQRDPSYEVYDKAPYHPLAGQCRGIASSLAQRLEDAGFSPRMIGGWYRKTGKGYYYPSDYATYPPEGAKKPGEAWSEHWWVEVDGYYVDVSADQFFPYDPEAQAGHRTYLKPKSFDDYYPHRRRPLGKGNALTPELESLAQKIAAFRGLKTKAGFRSDAGYYRLFEWLAKNAGKYGLDEPKAVELMAVARHEKMSYLDLSDVANVRLLLSELVD